MGILIVDDSEDIRLFLKTLVASLGHSVTTADSAAQALALLKQDAATSEHGIDIVLMDVVMPEMNGIEACRAIRESDDTKELPVIMVTALTDTEDLDKAFQAGANDYITKPVRKRELLARVRSSLALKNEMDRRKAREVELMEVTGRLEEVVKQLEKLSSIDGLTQVSNRRLFDQYLAAEWQRLQRNGVPLGLILADIDHFKLYNDTYGHLGGDECLKTVAQTLDKVVHRGGDLVCRYGGEEFAVILPETDSKGALAVGEAIRKAIEDLNMEHSTSLVSNAVTLSVGAASVIPVQELTPQWLIERADQALYEAKGRGRNRVVLGNTEF